MTEQMHTKSPSHDGRMSHEQTWFDHIDGLLRDKESAFAKVLQFISQKLGEKSDSSDEKHLKGDEYLNSSLKRILDLSIAVPAAVVATPVIMMLGIAKKVEDGGTAFFLQERYNTIPDDLDSSHEPHTFTIWKIRSMVEGAEKDAHAVVRQGTHEHLDPRATKLGKMFRKYKLDELPQLYQVVLGQLSAIGVRPLPKVSVKNFVSHLHGEGATSLYREWTQSYGQGKKGLTGLHQVRESGMRMHKEIFHYDTFYTKNASLGLDLYLLWATLGRILGYYPRRIPRTKEEV